MNATITTDTLPTTARVWQALRVLFGTEMAAASLTVLKLVDGNSHFITYTFPKETP